MPSLVLSQDIYERLADMDVDRRYAIWRYITHLVDWAPRKSAYRERLQELDVARMHDDMRRLLGATLEYSPRAIELLRPEQARVLMKVRAALPAPEKEPIVISEHPANLKVYRTWGFIV